MAVDLLIQHLTLASPRLDPEQGAMDARSIAHAAYWRNALVDADLGKGALTRKVADKFYHLPFDGWSPAGCRSRSPPFIREAARENDADRHAAAALCFRHAH